MKNILAKDQFATLNQFAKSNTLLALDFDGTLAATTKNQRSAQLRASTRRALAAVATRYPTAVISGRARADVLARLGGIDTQAVIGNHGLEPSPDAQRYRAMVKAWLPKLRETLDGQKGVEIENKLYSLSIHYRAAKTKSAALTAIRAAVNTLGKEARSIEGVLVINVLPAGAPHKGSALQALQRSLHTDTAIYIGDDATDEDAFSPDGAAPVLGIRVGRSTSSKADYYLPKQADIDVFLKRLLELRSAD